MSSQAATTGLTTMRRKKMSESLGKGLDELTEGQKCENRDKQKRALFQNIQTQANEMGEKIINEMVLKHAIQMCREAGYTVSKH